METPVNKRIDWIDCAKGLGILLVIFGHSLHYESDQVLIRGIIFSFHMPLFFILYGMTFRFSDDSKSFRKNLLKRFKHLFVPALISFILLTLIDLIYELDNLNITVFIKDHLTALLFCPGAAYEIGSLHIGTVSMLWFIFVLFYASVLIDFLHLHLPKRINVLICLILFVLGYFVIFAGFGLPLALDTVFLVIPFILFGKFIMTRIKIPDIRYLIGSLILWVLSFIVIVYFTGTYLEIAGRRYPLFPVCHIAAIAGTVFICGLCGYFTKLVKVSKPLVILGRYTLYVYIVHTFDYLFFFAWDSVNNYLAAVIRIAIDLVAALVICKSSKLIRKVTAKKE